MTLQLERPDVANMYLRTFDRALHPELFDGSQGCGVRNGVNRIDLRLGPTGHLIEFSCPQSTVSETAMTKFESLPDKGRIVERRLIGYRTHMVDLPGLRYHCSYQLEHVPLDVYFQLHREFEVDSRTATLSLTLPGATKASPDCISLIKCDVIPEGMIVHSFHTFPDNAAILRVQTLFERLD